jgi:hypothetical protein
MDYYVDQFGTKWAIFAQDPLNNHAFAGWVKNKNDLTQLSKMDPGSATFNSAEEARECIRAAGGIPQN